MGLPKPDRPAGAFEQDVAFSSTVFRRRNISARKRLLKCGHHRNGCPGPQQRGAHRHRLQAAVKSPPHTSLSGTKGQAAHLGKVPPRQPIDSISINVGTLVACELNAPLAIIGAGTPKPMVPFFVIGIPLSNFLLRFIGPAPNPPLSCSPPH